MEFNENDYQGENLQLTGEDSSKRSFVLPKFDFVDDNLHRFESSLVDNGVFLGQDENHWIEDFSRGNGGIQQYCSSATVTCDLPKCNNVWSEATSSESVEMLLKAVGQEDMIPGGNMVNQSDLANQVDLSGTDLRQGEKMDDVDGVKVAGFEGVSDVAEERDFSLCELNVDKEISLIATDSNLDKGEDHDSVIDSSSIHVQERLLVSGSKADKFDSSYQFHDPMLVDQSNITNTSFVSFSSISEGTAIGVDEQHEDLNLKDEITVQNGNLEMERSLQFPPVTESLHEEHVFETQVNKFEETLRVPESKESVSAVEDCGKLTLDVDPVLIASISGIKHPSEVNSVSHYRPSISSGDETQLDIKDSGGTPEICVAPDPRQVSVTQLSDQQQSHADGEDIYPGSSALEAQVATFESPKPSSPEQNDKSNCHHVDDLDNSIVSSFSGKHDHENPVIECTEEPVHTTTLLKERAEDEDHVSLTLLDGNKPTYLEDDLSKKIDDNSSMLADVQGCEHDLSACEKDDRLIRSAGNMVSDDNGKETGDTVSGVVVELNVETTNGSQSGASVEDCQVLDAKIKDEKLKSSNFEGEELADGHGQNSPSLEMAYMDQNKEVESEIQPITSNYVPPSLEDVSEFATATELENKKRLDPFGAGGTKTDDPPVSLVEISNSTLPEEAIQDLSEVDYPPSDSFVKSDGPEIMRSETTESTVVTLVEISNSTLPDEATQGLSEVDYPPSDSFVKNDGSEIMRTDKTTESTVVTLVEISNSILPDEEKQDLSEKVDYPPSDSLVKNDGSEIMRTDKTTESTVVTLVEISNSTLSDEATQDLSEKVDYPPSDSLVTTDGSEIMRADKTTESDISREANPSKALDCDSAAAEIYESNQPGPSSAILPGPSSAILPGQGESELNKKDVLEKDVENVGIVLPTSTNSGVNTLSKQEGSFTFDIRPLDSQCSEDTDKRLQQVPVIQTVQSLTGEVFTVTSGISQKDTVTMKEILQPTYLIPSGEAPSSEGVKCSSDRKPRRRTSKAGKDIAKMGNIDKETTPPHQRERLDKLPAFPSPLGACQLIKPMTGVSVSASCLPDLNTSGSSSANFRQSFTDLQQVQLRAQIFVYGSLIQGAAPEEACMVSAFGMSGAKDGGRGAWESSWRAFIENRRDKQTNKSETPLQSCSVSRASEQTSNHGFSRSEVLSTPVGRTTDKAAPSPLVNPIIPLSSPLWNATPSCAGLPSSTKPRFDFPAVSPLHLFQTPPIRGFTPHSTTWPSQPPYPVPWLTSSKGSPFDIRASYPASPITEPVILTPIIESSLPVKNHVPHDPAVHTGSTSVFTGTQTRVDLKKITGSTIQMTPSETKTRKRKKSLAVDAVRIPVTAAQVDSVSTSVLANTLPKIVDSVSVVSGHYSMPITAPTLGITSNQMFSAVLPSVSSDKRALDLESSSKVEEAKLHAEQAAALATEAVSHCESVWSTLNQQISSGITTNAESKLVSAAVAIAAAASVAKAAAAAAKIASNAAVQAKQIADEAITNDFTANTGSMTPVSILSGDENNASTSAISAARQAARKRVEATSAASRHAENLDAIIKAAELAAEAVSHTGKIVGMGDPFSLNELVRAGPDGYWRISHVDPAPTSEPKETNKNEVFTQQHSNVSMNLHLVPDKDLQDSGHVMPPFQTKNLIDSVESEENNVKRQKDKGVFNCVETVGTVSESDIELRSTSFTPYESNAGIKEGSVVEVLKDLGNTKKAWYSARVLSIQGDKALVCYTELHSDEGSDPEEWISLQPQVGEAPVIRVARPSKSVQNEETRKRRRSATEDYAWSVGDRVDARLKDCWREGIITETNKKDPTTVTVSFSAEEEILNVEASHLRPTLIWSDNQWSEFWRQGHNEGDVPVGKRPKLGTSDIKSKGEDNMVKKTGVPETGTSSEQLPLSSKETIFGTGSKNDENNVRTMRPGLQKQGPRVMFGVPEPGKKRKFMEVGKHYGSERTNKTTPLNNSAKSAKSSLPLGFGSRVNNPKIGTKEKKQEPDFKTRKPPVPTRTTLRKGDSTSSQPNTSTATSSDRPLNDSSMSNSQDDNESGEPNVNELRSFSNVEGTSRGIFVFSSLATSTENRKKAVTRRTRPERLNKGNFLPKSGKSAESDSDEKLESEVSEPRRSNRRIQPTSRLLEGLQSSLIIPKLLSSHDKGQRSHRGTPKRE